MKMRREVGLEKTKAILKLIGFVMSKSKSKRGVDYCITLWKSLWVIFTIKKGTIKITLKSYKICVLHPVTPLEAGKKRRNWQTTILPIVLAWLFLDF